MCTNLAIKAGDNSVIVARSMDFASPTGLKTGEWSMGHKINKDWKVNIPFIAKYTEKDLGIGTLRCVSDGFNKSGLSIGTLWLPSAQFKNALRPSGNEISGLVAVQIILGNCNNVKEAVDFLNARPIVMPAKVIDRFVTLHFVLVDKEGNSSIVEFGTDGKPSSVQVYKSEVGVLTNAPEYPWQLRNLSNVTQIGLVNTESKKFGSYEVKHTGFGANQLGLAGDASPPSRFVRATTLMHAAMEHAYPAKAADAELLLDKVMGSVSVIKGTSADTSLTGKKYDYTQWIVLKNLNKYTMKIKTSDSLGFVDAPIDQVKDSADENEAIWDLFAGMSEAALAEFNKIFGL